MEKKNSRKSATTSQKAINVSIVVPCCNVEKYLDECLSSIVKQTLKEIEIICINDGSKDKTIDIIKKYAAKDSRIVVVDKPNSGYGDSMNIGFSKARGRYIGIVESDDFIEPNMFEKLYKTAREFDADVVKSNFWFYWSNPERNELHEYFKKEECGYVICPHEYDNGSLYGRKPSIWSAIYKREFIEKNNISFLPTPGASFQDTSFTFKVYSSAKKMVCLYDSFLHYRQDNENSSVNNADKKIEFVFKEYREIERFINEGPYKKELYPIYAAAFYDTCMWTYERLSVSKRYGFLKTISPWFKEFVDNIGVENIAFRECWWKRRDIVRIANDPMEYQTWRNVERYEQNIGNLTFKNPVTPADNILQVMNSPVVDKPRFSIIVPVYNVEKYLHSCMDSIVNQTFENIEIICVNDGTKDHCLSILEEYAEFDKRIRIINQKNAGLAAARNSGLKVAVGEYVLFVDSDDYISERTCEILDKRIKESTKDSDAILFGTNIFPENPRAGEWYYSTLETEDEYIEGITSEDIAEKSFLSVFCWRYCFKKAFIDKHNVAFDSSVRYGEDAVFLFAYLPLVNCIMSISDKLYNYRHYRENSLMNDAKRDNSVYAQHQLTILDTVLKAAKKNSESFSETFYMYASDFVYSSIEGCEEQQRFYYRNEFVKLMKKHKLDAYVNKCPENYIGYWNDCVSTGTKTLTGKKTIGGTRGFARKVLPPSRQSFYDYNSKLLHLATVQQSIIEGMQYQMNDMQRQLNDQMRAIEEIRWLSNELLKKYNDDKLWKLFESLEKIESSLHTTENESDAKQTDNNAKTGKNTKIQK